jgi:uncharacterized protein (TIRG00374 family)
MERSDVIAENSEKTRPSSKTSRLLPWFNLVLSILLIALGIWYLAGKVSLKEGIQAILLAKPGYVLLGVFIVLATLLVKAWRWQLMFMTSDDSLRLTPFFWASLLGQYVNLIVPFMRLGEIARIYALNRQTDIAMARSLGTLVVEKVLDLIMFTLTIAILLPLVILPEIISEPGWILWTLPFATLLVLYLLAYKTKLITRFFQAMADKFPAQFGKRLLRWSISGLEGLASLRNHRLSLLLVASSAFIALLSLLLPFVLFLAFDLPLGLVAATLIHVAVTIAITPPSTPGKIGVFNGAVAFVLIYFGLADEAIIISYSIVFHLVAVLPQIVLGIIAASRTNWRWQRSLEQQMTAGSG